MRLSVLIEKKSALACGSNSSLGSMDGLSERKDSGNLLFLAYVEFLKDDFGVWSEELEVNEVFFDALGTGVFVSSIPCFSLSWIPNEC